MARKKSPFLAAPFQGKWRIAEMDLWDDEAMNLLGDAFISIKGQDGEMRFIAVTAWLDIRYDARSGEPTAEFSWEGVDEGDRAAAAAGLSKEPQATLSGTFSSTTATIQASCAFRGELFNGLLGAFPSSAFTTGTVDGGDWGSLQRLLGTDYTPWGVNVSPFVTQYIASSRGTYEYFSDDEPLNATDARQLGELVR